MATRNQRLAGIHALARFIGESSPEHVEWCTQICLILFKKATQVGVSYLDKQEMDALLAAPAILIHTARQAGLCPAAVPVQLGRPRQRGMHGQNRRYRLACALRPHPRQRQ